MTYVPWFQKPENERTALQIVNLSPSEDSLEKLTEMHPMRQIVWATISASLGFRIHDWFFYTYKSVSKK